MRQAVSFSSLADDSALIDALLARTKGAERLFIGATIFSYTQSCCRHRRPRGFWSTTSRRRSMSTCGGTISEF